MSDSVRPHRWQPTRLPHPWESPGKNTGVGCHFLLQCMKVKSQSEVTQSYPTLSDPMDCNLPGSSVHGIFQARVLKWGAIVFSILTYYKVQINIESCVFKKHIWSSALGLENRPFLCFKIHPVFSIFTIALRQEAHWRRQWYPTPVLLPAISHGWRSLVGCSPWGR